MKNINFEQHYKHQIYYVTNFLNNYSLVNKYELSLVIHSSSVLIDILFKLYAAIQKNGIQKHNTSNSIIINL